MKPIKRQHLELDEQLNFGKKKGYVHHRYFDKSMYPDLKNPFTLYIDYTMIPRPKQVSITLTYLDTAKKTLPAEKLEHVENHKLLLDATDGPGKKQTPIKIPLKDGSKELWKVTFEVEDRENTVLNLSA